MSHKINKNQPETWIEIRIEGIIDRNRFTDALKYAVVNLDPKIYGHATQEIYQGLWERTTQILRQDLNITNKQNPRDYMDEYALIYIRLTEKACADLLNDAQAVSYNQAINIVRATAQLIHEQAANTSRALGIDLVTGKPLRRKDI